MPMKRDQYVYVRAIAVRDAIDTWLKGDADRTEKDLYEKVGASDTYFAGMVTRADWNKRKGVIGIPHDRFNNLVEAIGVDRDRLLAYPVVHETQNPSDQEDIGTRVPPDYRKHLPRVGIVEDPEADDEADSDLPPDAAAVLDRDDDAPPIRAIGGKRSAGGCGSPVASPASDGGCGSPAAPPQPGEAGPAPTPDHPGDATDMVPAPDQPPYVDPGVGARPAVPDPDPLANHSDSWAGTPDERPPSEDIAQAVADAHADRPADGDPKPTVDVLIKLDPAAVTTITGLIDALICAEGLHADLLSALSRARDITHTPVRKEAERSLADLVSEIAAGSNRVSSVRITLDVALSG
jgi:hypothetical protein